MEQWRKDYFLKHFSTKDKGLEIGPSHNPIAAKKDGYKVTIVDHADQEGLIKKYKKLGIDTSKIEKVDYVWDGNQTMTELINQPKSFDYIIASHVVEHTTDLLTFLEDCESLLKPTGKLCLAVPDKRYCFDYFRFPTNAGELIEAHRKKNVRHTPGKVFDFLINATKKGEDSAWGSESSGDFEQLYDLKFIKKKYKEAQKAEEYFDIHNWMFTPASFKLLISDLQKIGLTKLSYADSMPTQGFEFFVVLSPKAKKIEAPRIELAKEMMEDIKTMLRIDERHLHEKIEDLENEIERMRNSKRWRYADVPAKIVNRVSR